jgi:hypothetical protein
MQFSAVNRQRQKLDVTLILFERYYPVTSWNARARVLVDFKPLFFFSQNQRKNRRHIHKKQQFPHMFSLPLYRSGLRW